MFQTWLVEIANTVASSMDNEYHCTDDEDKGDGIPQFGTSARPTAGGETLSNIMSVLQQ